MNSPSPLSSDRLETDTDTDTDVVVEPVASDVSAADGDEGVSSCRFGDNGDFIGDASLRSIDEGADEALAAAAAAALIDAAAASSARSP